MDIQAIVGVPVGDALLLATEAGGGETGFQINLFWVVTQAVSFLLFLGIVYLAAFRRIGTVLEERRSRIEQGLRDADAARRDREAAADERQAVISQARNAAQEIVGRAQKQAEEARTRETAETRAELERIRAQALEEIEAEKQRALGEIRGEVADLALRAASRVVGETMTEARERRLVEEFLGEVAGSGAVGGAGRGPGRSGPEQP